MQRNKSRAEGSAKPEENWLASTTDTGSKHSSWDPVSVWRQRVLAPRTQRAQQRRRPPSE